jgi:hypothetical protein
VPLEPELPLPPEEPVEDGVLGDDGVTATLSPFGPAGPCGPAGPGTATVVGGVALEVAGGVGVTTVDFSQATRPNAISVTSGIEYFMMILF